MDTINAIADVKRYNDLFYSHVREQTKKKRNCLKCRCPFVSASSGNRTCGSCTAQNRRAGLRAQTAPYRVFEEWA